MVQGCMVYTECAETTAVSCGTSHNYKNQTALYVHHFGEYSRRAIKSDSHSFKIASDKSAVSVIESGE